MDRRNKKFIGLNEESVKDFINDIKEYEKICPECNGYSISYVFYECNRCKNKGKIDWIDEMKIQS